MPWRTIFGPGLQLSSKWNNCLSNETYKSYFTLQFFIYKQWDEGYAKEITQRYSETIYFSAHLLRSLPVIQTECSCLSHPWKAGRMLLHLQYCQASIQFIILNVTSPLPPCLFLSLLAGRMLLHQYCQASIRDTEMSFVPSPFLPLSLFVAPEQLHCFCWCPPPSFLCPYS